MNFARACLEWLKQNWFWLKWLVAAALLGGLFYQNREQIGRLSERTIDWRYFAVALVFNFTATVLTIVRWFLLVWAQEFPFRLKDALRLGFIGYFFTYFSPGAAGGDIVKAVLIARQQTSRRSIAAATVLLDRILGMVGLLIVGAIASLFLSDTLRAHRAIHTITLIMWGGGIGGVICVSVLLHPAVPRLRWLGRLVRLRYVGRLIGEIINAILLYQRRRRVVAAAIGISIVGHVATLSSFYNCVLALQLGRAAPDYWTNLLLIPGAEVAGVLLPTPGGVGGLEAAVQYLYSIANEARGSPVPDKVAQGAGLFAAVMFRVIVIMIASIGAVYYFSSKRDIKQAIDESQ